MQELRVDSLLCPACSVALSRVFQQRDQLGALDHAGVADLAAVEPALELLDRSTRFIFIFYNISFNVPDLQPEGVRA
jgi:hypothetical protein